MRRRSTLASVTTASTAARMNATSSRPGLPQQMPAFRWADDQWLSAILTYARNEWGNKADPVTAEDLARSGTPLFVSLELAAATPEERKDLVAALDVASRQLPLGEPLDWLTDATPNRWRLNGEDVTYDWS